MLKYRKQEQSVKWAITYLSKAKGESTPKIPSHLFEKEGTISSFMAY
jgi:hypothetical protein